MGLEIQSGQWRARWATPMGCEQHQGYSATAKRVRVEARPPAGYLDREPGVMANAARAATIAMIAPVVKPRVNPSMPG